MKSTKVCVESRYPATKPQGVIGSAARNVLGRLPVCNGCLRFLVENRLQTFISRRCKNPMGFFVKNRWATTIIK